MTLSINYIVVFFNMDKIWFNQIQLINSDTIYKHSYANHTQKLNYHKSRTKTFNRLWNFRTLHNKLNRTRNICWQATLGRILQPLREWFLKQGHAKPFSQESLERVQTRYTMPTTSFPLPCHQECSVLWWTLEKTQNVQFFDELGKYDSVLSTTKVVCSERECHWGCSFIRVMKWQHYCMSTTHYRFLMAQQIMHGENMVSVS